MSFSNGFGVVVRPATEASQQVTVVREDSFEHVVVTLAGPPPSVEFPLQTLADSNLLVCGPHLDVNAYVDIV